MMNFCYDLKIAAQIAAYVYYVSPVQGVSDEIKKSDPSLATNPLLFPTQDVIANQHSWQFLSDEIEQQLNDLYFDLAGSG
jgi:spermidine/putrescine transport system substrate-binding protein